MTNHDIEQLIEAGRIALREREYDHAARLLREAARRAPMRQDVRELLAMAVDGTLAVRRHERDATPQPSAPLAALRAREVYGPHPAAQGAERAANGGERHTAVIETIVPAGTQTEVIELEPARPARRPLHGPGADGGRAGRSQSTFGPRPTVNTAEIPEPTNFHARHRRGPLSALVTTVVAGLALCAAAGGLAWAYYEHGDKLGLRPSPLDLQLAKALDQAREYRDMGKISLAINALESLPQSGKRDVELARIFTDKGNAALSATPPQAEGALEDFKQAANFNPNNLEAIHGQATAYFRLAGKVESQETRTRYLKQARELLETSLTLDPRSVRAMWLLSEVAIRQRDDILVARMYRQIIETAPDSNEAREARNRASQRNLKL